MLSAEIDAQLHELNSSSISHHKNLDKDSTASLPPKQCQNIETATDEKAKHFLQKFQRAAYNDLCKEGGLLYQQWQTYGDLSNEKTLKTFGGILVAMGITGATLQTVVVAITVIVLHIGVKAICTE
jgi:hypothetical protein